MKIEQFIDEVLEREGGFVDHPNDKGGPTNHGITEQVARAYGYTGAMRDMPPSVARQIYRERYWLQPRFDQVYMYSAAVAEEMLDTGINMGTGVAARFLQRALNVLNLQGKTYPDIAVDGALGNMTLAALRAYLAARGKEGHVVLWRMLNAQQSVRYIEIAEANPTQESFQHGWQANRVGGTPL